MLGKARIKARLREMGLASVYVGDDGNCQFRSLSQQLFGDEKFHAYVRKRAVQRMREERTFFRAIFSDDAEFEEYLRVMSEDKTWGDELTLRAVADSYGCTVHVVTSNEANWYLQYVPNCDPKKHLFLNYISPVHYDALTLANSPPMASCSEAQSDGA